MKFLRLKNYIIKLFNNGYAPLDIGIKEKGVSSCPICDCKSFYNFHQPQDQNYSNIISVCLRCGPYTYKRKKANSIEGGADLIGYFPMYTTNIPNYNLSSYLRHRFESNKISNINDIANIESKDTLDLLVENANANIPKFSEKQYYLLRTLESLQEDLGEKIYLKVISTDFNYMDMEEFFDRYGLDLDIKSLYNKMKIYYLYDIDKKIIKNMFFRNFINDSEYTGKYIIDLSKLLNDKISVYDNLRLKKSQILADYLISFSYLKKDEELELCLKNLYNSNYINYKSKTYGGTHLTTKFIEILPNGYEYLENNKIEDQTKSNKVFVAMSFKEENNNLWETIKTTLENDLGYEAIRSDKKDYEGWIMDFILSSINESKFIIADISDGNNGVYFEVGYALGKKIPVIPIAKNNIESIHFDLKQYNIITHDNLENLEEQLYWRIKHLFDSNK